jgi:hypothetical protein
MIRDPQKEPHEILDPKRVGMLQAAFQALSPDVRTALWLYVAEDEPIEKVAAVLGIPHEKTCELFLSGSTALEPLLGQQAFGDERAELLRRHLRAFRTPEPTPGFTERLQRIWDHS